jgi:hypothetical protein
MNQEAPVESSVFSKLLAIWGVIVVLIFATAIFVGGQVYWWQKAEAKKEQQQLQQQIIDLKNEIRVLKNNIAVSAAVVKKAGPASKLAKSAKKDKLFKDQLAGADQTVITLLHNGDLERLAEYIHPKLGLRFSPFAYVDLKKDLVFSSAELTKNFRTHHEFIWGYDDSNGLPIRLNIADYYKMYVYDRPYADTNEISYTQAISSEFTTSNCFEAYPHAIIVEYRVSELNSKESSNTNWQSIRLAFEKEGNRWYLAGIIHDQWML